MSLWNYIGELFLFRWLFSSHKHNETKHNLSDTTASSNNDNMSDDTNSHIGYGSRYDNNYSRYNNHDYGYSQSYDNFLDEQDDYDMMDDDF